MRRRRNPRLVVAHAAPFTVGGLRYNNPTGLDVRAEYRLSQRQRKKAFLLLTETGFYTLAGYHFGKFLPVVRYVS